jgi:peptidylprolyl isomerase
MHTARLGDRVRIHYARVREPSTAGGKPPNRRAVEFTVGTSNMIPTLSMGVVGMVPGQHKRFRLPPGEAYGAVQPRLIREIPRQRLPIHLALAVGQRLAAVDGISGRRRRVTVVEIRPRSVVVDGNHPLAGKVIELEITLISVDSSSNANRAKPQFNVGGES